MQKAILVLMLLPMILTSAATWPAETDIPASAEKTIQEDYLEWVHPPKLAGPCEELPVVKVEWITPRGVTGRRPVIWLKAERKFAAILGLADAQAEWIGGYVSAQPLMLLQDVSVYRLCRFSNVTPW
jgi:hypothetical protein